MTLKKVAAGLYRTKSGSVRIVDEQVFRFDASERWAAYWVDAIGGHHEKRFPSLRAVRAWLNASRGW